MYNILPTTTHAPLHHPITPTVLKNWMIWLPVHEQSLPTQAAHDSNLLPLFYCDQFEAEYKPCQYNSMRTRQSAKHSVLRSQTKNKTYLNKIQQHGTKILNFLSFKSTHLPKKSFRNSFKMTSGCFTCVLRRCPFFSCFCCFDLFPRLTSNFIVVL